MRGPHKVPTKTSQDDPTFSIPWGNTAICPGCDGAMGTEEARVPFLPFE